MTDACPAELLQACFLSNFEKLSWPLRGHRGDFGLAPARLTAGRLGRPDGKTRRAGQKEPRQVMARICVDIEEFPSPEVLDLSPILAPNAFVI